MKIKHIWGNITGARADRLRQLRRYRAQRAAFKLIAQMEAMIDSTPPGPERRALLHDIHYTRMMIALGL